MNTCTNAINQAVNALVETYKAKLREHGVSDSIIRSVFDSSSASASEADVRIHVNPTKNPVLVVANTTTAVEDEATADIIFENGEEDVDDSAATPRISVLGDYPFRESEMSVRLKLGVEKEWSSASTTNVTANASFLDENGYYDGPIIRCEQGSGGSLNIMFKDKDVYNYVKNSFVQSTNADCFNPGIWTVAKGDIQLFLSYVEKHPELTPKISNTNSTLRKFLAVKTFGDDGEYINDDGYISTTSDSGLWVVIGKKGSQGTVIKLTKRDETILENYNCRMITRPSGLCLEKDQLSKYSGLR